jgi:hypothetical protein
MQTIVTIALLSKVNKHKELLSRENAFLVFCRTPDGVLMKIHNPHRIFVTVYLNTFMKSRKQYLSERQSLYACAVVLSSVELSTRVNNQNLQELQYL